MAIAGDVVVNFAANFAQFSDGMKTAQAALGKFGDEAAKLNSKIDGAFAFLKGAGITAAATAVFNELRKLAEESERVSLEISGQAAKLKISTNQYQAYSLAAKTAGTTVEDVTKQLKDNSTATDQLIRYYKDLGLVIDQEAIAKFARMDAAAEESKRKINALIAPIYAEVKSSVLDAIANSLTRINNILNAINLSTLEKIILLTNPLTAVPALAAATGGAVGGAANGTVEQQIDRINGKIAEQIQLINKLRAGGPNVWAGDILPAQQELERLQEARRKLTQPVPQLPPITVTATPDKTTTGGGGGKTDAENIQAQIERYKSLSDAVWKTSAAIQNQRQEKNLLYEDLQREAKIQNQINEIAAKLGAKYNDAAPALKQQLREEITLYERRKEEQGKWLEAVKQAEDINNRLGSGDIARRRRDEQLARMDRGGIEPAARSRYLKETNEQLEQARLNAARFDDDLGSLGAGFESAANAYARANDMFSQGQQIFTGLTTAMGDALDVLVGKSDKSFGDIAYSFARMLADMAMRAALSQIFNAIIGSFTSIPTPASQGINIGAVGPPGMFPGRASGGPVDPSNVYVVGERGPEYFVPNAAGNIVPMTSSNKGNGDNITVNVEMGTTQGSSADPAKMMAFGRQMKAAIKDVIANEKRPGGSLYSRQSA